MINNKYKFEYVPKDPTRVNTKNDYIGAYFTIIEDSELRRNRIIVFWACTVLIFVSLGVSLFLNNDLFRLFYVVMPYACNVLIWVYLLFAVIGYSGRVDRLERKACNNIVNRMKTTALLGIIFSAISVIGAVLSFAFRLALLNTSNIITFVFVCMTLVSFVIVFIKALGFKTDIAQMA